MHPLPLMQDAARVIREFMDRDPGELRFTMTALAAPGEDEEEEAEAAGGDA